MRICLVYDCLYPYTVGGAERWYRNLGEHLVASGHQVTYLTLRQWERGEEPLLAGVRVQVVGPRMQLYGQARRRVLPPLVFGLGVLAHLARRGHRYDVVHTASFPYFSLLAAAAVRYARRFELVVDWHEVWTREYWRDYLGPVGGAVGWKIQRLCLSMPQRAFCFSRLHEHRLREAGLDPLVLQGQYAGTEETEIPAPAEPLLVFAGRHVPEKRVTTIIPAVLQVREQLPLIRAELYGDGPDRQDVLRLIRESDLDGTVVAPGFVDFEQIDQALRKALCLLLPSTREGYGLIVLEAAARGTPTVLVHGPDNAAAELLEEGVNGFVAASASASDLASAVLRVERAGYALRKSTAAWFRRNASRLSLEHSLEIVLKTYADG